MYMPFRNDEALIAAIRSGGSARESALQYLYQKPGLREAASRHVLDHGGSVQDAQDVFQEAFVLLDRNLREGRFEGRSSLQTYVVAIVKWRWWSVRRSRGRFAEWAPAQHEAPVESVEEGYIDEERRSLLNAALEQIGARCKALLRLYQLDYSMEEIAGELGYQSPDVAKKEAWRCRMKLREVLEKQQV